MHPMPLSQDEAPRARIWQIVSQFARDCSGTTAIEYAVMTFIAVAVIVAVGQLGETVGSMYERVQEAFSR
jgi:Flp pilus assembly pilin Flp